MNPQTQIDFRTVPINVPSLCIPRVYPNISENRIRKIFDDLSLGAIDHVDIIGKTTEKGEKFNRVFIHFRRWYTDGNAEVARERLLNGKDIKIIYDDPWFWKVSAYREQAPVSRPDTRQQNHSQKKPTILFDDEDDNKKPRKQQHNVQRPRPVSSSYDDDKRIKQTHSHSRQEHIQKERPKQESGGFKKVSKADTENRKKQEEAVVRPITIAPTLSAPTLIAPTLSAPIIAPTIMKADVEVKEEKVEVKEEKVEVKEEKVEVKEEKVVEVKEEKEEDEMMKQKVPPKKKLRALIGSTAKKPLLKVEEIKKEQPEEELEEGEIVEN
jgi:hypothetical protein